MKDIIVDTEFSRYRSNERESAKNYIKNFLQKRILSYYLTDRGYISNSNFAHKKSIGAVELSMVCCQNNC